MKKINHALLLLVLTCANITAAQSSVLTFDDVTNETWDAIPNGYGGLSWSNFWVIAPNFDPTIDIPFGWQNGLVSGDFVAYNEFGGAAEVSSIDAFDFNGAYFNAAYRDGLEVTATGLRNGAQLYQTTITVDTNAAQYFAFNFAGIDTLQFAATGGEYAWGEGTHFNIDNLDINVAPVPVPAAVWLFGSAMLGSVRLRKRQR